MEREFISLEIFNKLWERLGLTDTDLKMLQEYLCIYPDAGNVIKGTGGVRKLRWSLKDKGKRGGVRVLYIDFVIYEKIYLLTVYPKSRKDDISEKEKKAICTLVNDLRDELRRKNNE